MLIDFKTKRCISVIFFLREGKKKMSKGEGERGRERGRVNGNNCFILKKKMGINNGQSTFHLNL